MNAGVFVFMRPVASSRSHALHGALLGVFNLLGTLSEHLAHHADHAPLQLAGYILLTVAGDVNPGLSGFRIRQAVDQNRSEKVLRLVELER